MADVSLSLRDLFNGYLRGLTEKNGRLPRQAGISVYQGRTAMKRRSAAGSVAMICRRKS